MTNSNPVHAKINVRAMMIESIMIDGERTYGGKGNATVTSANFKTFAGLKANYAVNGLNPYRNK